MKKLDPRLRQLVGLESSADVTMMERVGIAPKIKDFDLPLEVEVLVRCRDAEAIRDLRQAGVAVRFSTEGVHPVVSGTVPMLVLHELSDMPGVERVEASREMVTELNISCGETRA